MATEDDAGKAIRAYCLGLLARRDHSRKELINKCQLKGFAKTDLTPILDELAEQGWQSDQRYAENYVRQRVQKGYGPIAVRYALMQKGVQSDDIERILDTFADHWLDLSEQVYRKKYPSESRISRQEWAKRSRFLMQRGFPAELVASLPAQLGLKFSAMH